MHISLDAANLNGEADALKETLASEFNLEDYVVNQERMSALRSELREWRYWGTDMLNVFLQGQNRQSMKEFTEKYGVSNVTVAKWKKIVHDIYERVFEMKIAQKFRIFFGRG